MDDETRSLIVKEEQHVRLGSLALRPEAVIESATNMANELAKVVRTRRLVQNIQGKEYVKVEGWNTLGAMLGVLPIEESVTRLDNGYEAAVALIRTSDGLKIGGASAICMKDEKRWASAPEFAVRSMAITRATGKAFRLGFSWIMALAGFEPTPAEELDFLEGDYRETSPEAPRKAQEGPSAPAAQEVPSQPRNPQETPQRPYSPEMVLRRVEEKAAFYETTRRTASTKQQGLTIGMLEECFAGEGNEREKRHSVQAWLTGVEETQQIGGIYWLALLDWLSPDQDSGGAYHPHPMATKEAHAIVTMRMKELGQEDLFAGPSETAAINE